MKKKLLIILPIVSILLAGLIFYLFVWSGMQAKDYKKRVEVAQSDLKEAIDKVYSTSTVDELIGDSSEVELDYDKSEKTVEYQEAAIKELETKLGLKKQSLTEFNAMFGMDWFSDNYRKAKELNNFQKEYTQQIEAYITESRALAKYNRDSLAILELFEEQEKLNEDAGNVSSVDNLKGVFSKISKVLDDTLKIARDMSVPESYKTQHEEAVKYIEDTKSLMTEYFKAIEDMDLAKLEKLTVKIEKFQKETEDKTKEYKKLFLKESKFVKNYEAQKSTREKIDQKISEIM